METVYNLEKLVDYPVGAFVNLQCPEYKGVVCIEDVERCLKKNAAPCDLCVLLGTRYTCPDLCCIAFRKDKRSVFFKPIKIRSVDTLDELAKCKVGEPVHVFTKCFVGYVVACEVVGFESCRNCAFNSPFTPCGPCTASQREDGHEVYFEKI